VLGQQMFAIPAWPGGRSQLGHKYFAVRVQVRFPFGGAGAERFRSTTHPAAGCLHLDQFQFRRFAHALSPHQNVTLLGPNAKMRMPTIKDVVVRPAPTVPPPSSSAENRTPSSTGWRTTRLARLGVNDNAAILTRGFKRQPSAQYGRGG